MVLAHGLNCSTACGIFLDQGWNPCLLHWQADSLPQVTGDFFFLFSIPLYFLHLLLIYPSLAPGLTTHIVNLSVCVASIVYTSHFTFPLGISFPNSHFYHHTWCFPFSVPPPITTNKIISKKKVQYHLPPPQLFFLQCIKLLSVLWGNEKDETSHFIYWSFPVFCALHFLLNIPVSMERGGEGGRKKKEKKRKKGGKMKNKKKERKISPCSERYYC